MIDRYAKDSRLAAVFFMLCLVAAPIAGCADAGDQAATEQAGGAAAEHGPEGEGGDHAAATAGEHAADDSGEHVHDGGGDVPTRADEAERDEYSKPGEVYAFGGLGSGDTVVDIGAGSGYNTYLVSQLVGPTGQVFAVGGNDALAARIERGDLAAAGNITIVPSRAEVPDGVADAVLLIREYHLADDYLGLMADLSRILADDGVLVVVEVRNNEAEGHDMPTHRLGEQTVIDQFAEGGFQLDGQSDILRRDDDDYTAYGGPTGARYITDRMLMRFVKAR